MKVESLKLGDMVKVTCDTKNIHFPPFYIEGMVYRLAPYVSLEYVLNDVIHSISISNEDHIEMMPKDKAMLWKMENL
jgi:hypothetical protein